MWHEKKIGRLIIALLLLLSGAIAFIWPPVMYKIIGYLLGAGLILNGLELLWTYISLPQKIKISLFDLIGGFIFLAVGIVLIALPVTILQTALGFIVGFGLLLISLSLIVRSLLERPYYHSWIVKLLVGFIILFGCVLVFSQIEASSDALVRIIGGVSIYLGISQLLAIYLLKPPSSKDNDHVDIDFTNKE